MPRINLQDFDDDLDLPARESIRKNQDPVDYHQATQRRAEDGINRYRKLRALKEKNRDA